MASTPEVELVKQDGIIISVIISSWPYEARFVKGDKGSLQVAGKADYSKSVGICEIPVNVFKKMTKTAAAVFADHKAKA